MTVERSDDKAFRLIRMFVRADAEHTAEIGEILDAIADVIKSTGRNQP